MERSYATIAIPGRRETTRHLFARERLLLAILDHAGDGTWQETYRAIAKLTGLNEKSVHRAATELRTLGLIYMTDEFEANGARLPNRWGLTAAGRKAADALETLVDDHSPQ